MPLRQVFAKFCPEPVEEQHAAGRYNPSTEVIVNLRKRPYRLKGRHGTRDTVDVFTDGDSVYILNTNSGLDYVGLTRFDLCDAEEGKPLEYSSEVFVDSESDLKEMVGNRGFDYTPRTLVVRLCEYLG